jgi:ACT domain-containing protein
LTSSKLSAELISIVRDKLELGPEERVNVRVFPEGDAVLERVSVELEGKGLTIKNIQEGPNVAITGTLAVQNVPGINSVSEANKVEYYRKS